ncbi:hypothetical protein V8D89_001650 [Ganoderma adspersum]
MLCGAILPEHWERFQVYAERIRIISSYLTESDSVHPSVWLFLAARCRGAPLIPRLRELEAYYLTLSEAPPLALPLSPTLRVLELRFALETAEKDRLHASHVASSFLQNLPLMAPNIENLLVRADFDLGLKSLQSIERFSRLKLLFTPPTIALDEHMLQVLSTIPALQDLSCWIDLSSSTTAFGPHVFHQLNKLTVAGPSDHLVTVILACRFPNLVRISLRITQRADEIHPRDLFAALCQRCNPTLLTSLEINFAYEFASRLRSLTRFQPLLTLPNITSFHLIFMHTEPSLCDDDLARFGAAWPQLASFKVEHRTRQYSQREVVRPTLSGIIDLARRCPALTAFHIPELDPRAIPETSAVPALGHGLRFASIINIRPPISLQVYLEVATVLDRVFPTIDLDEASRGLFPWGNGWAEIVSFLKAMRVGRANGGAYADLGLQG